MAAYEPTSKVMQEWCGFCANRGWVWDANKALRFAREADAADYIASQTFLHGKPTEHVFIGTPSEHHQREGAGDA